MIGSDSGAANEVFAAECSYLVLQLFLLIYEIIDLARNCSKSRCCQIANLTKPLSLVTLQMVSFFDALVILSIIIFILYYYLPKKYSGKKMESLTELKQVPSDLQRYRKRIDSGVKEQRKNIEIVQNLNDTVMKCRQKAAEVEVINSARSMTHGQSYPSLLCGNVPGSSREHCWTHQSIAFPSTSGEYHFTQSTPGIPSLNFRYSDVNQNSDDPRKKRSIKFVDNLDNFPFSGNTEDDSVIEIYKQRLQEEKYRRELLEDMVETFKKQADNSSHINGNLTSDLKKLHESLMVSEQNRLRRLKHEQQVLQRQFYDLSMEIGRLKRKINELKADTEADLENYRSDFERSARNIENRIKHQENMRYSLKEKATKEQDAALEEVMKRYDEAVSKSIATEHERNEISRKVIFLESALKRAQEEKERVEEALKKIHQLPEIAEALGRRARSVSPVHINSLGNETIRNIRFALHSKIDEAENQRKELGTVRKKNEELEEKLDKVEKEKRQTERNLKEEKNSKEELAQDKESLEKQIQKFQEKLEKSETERNNLNSTILKLNEQISDLKVNHQSAIDEIRVKSQRDWDEQFKQMQIEHDQLEENLNQRIQRGRNENENLRGEMSKQRDTYHELQNELISERRKVIEKEAENSEISKKIDSFINEIANLKIQLQVKEVTIVQLEKQNSDYEHKEKLSNEKIDELQEEKATLMQENNSLSSEINELRGEIEDLTTKLETQQQSESIAYEQVENYKEQMKEMEKKNNQIRTAISDLELKLESTSERCRGLERELMEEKSEVTKNLTIIGDMNKERAELVNIRESLQSEIETLKRDLVEHIAKREQTDKQFSDLEIKLTETEDEKERLEATKQALTNRVKELNNQIAALKDHIAKSEDSVKEHKETLKMEIQKHREQSEDLLKNLRAEHAVELEKEEATKTELRTEVSSLKTKLEKLNDEYSKLLEDQKLQTEHFDFYRSDKTEEINRLKADLLQISEDSRKDLMDASDQRLKEKSEFEERIKRLEKDLENAEEDIKEGLMRENELKSKIEILESRISQGADMVLRLKKQLEELGEKSEELNAQAESERENLRSQIDQLNGNLSWAKQEKEELSRKVKELEKTLQLNESRSQKQQMRLKEADDEISSANSKIGGLESVISELKFKVRGLETQLSEVNDQKERIKTLQKQLENKNSELTNDQTSLKHQVAVLEAKLSDSDQRYEKRLSEMRKLNAERRNLELSVTDKSTELSSLNTLMKQYEQHQITYLKEISEEKEKSLKLEQEVAGLRIENKNLKEEFSDVKGQVEKKTAINQAVINDLVDNNRKMEKDRIVTMKELHEANAQIEILKNRVDLNETKKNDMERRLVEIEKEKEDLKERLMYYERSAKKALSFAKTQTSTSIRTHSQGPQPRYRNLDLDEDLLTSPRLGKPSSIPDLPQVVHRERIPRTASGSTFDTTNSMELTFKILKDKIADLEEERTELINRLRRSRTETEDTVESLNQQKVKVTDLQKIIHDLQETKATLEHKLISSRQVLLAQEESIRAREKDRNAFKAKMASADMHARDKEARLHSLQSETAALKVEIQNLEEDKKKFKEAEASWERDRRHLEAALREVKSELDKTQIERTVLVREKEKPFEGVRLIESVNRIVTLTHRIKESEHTSHITQQKCAELERTIERRQQSLTRLQQDESQWKNKIDSMRKSATDIQQLELKIESLKIELETMTQKWKNSEADREQIRRELIDCKSRLNSATLKINDLNVVINEVSGERKRCQDRIDILEKYERDNSSTERELRRELEQIKNERLSFVADLEEYRRQLHKVEVAKKELEAQVQRLERERIALKRHVENVETDKQRIESAIRQTTLERHALDKSLNAMEKENSELYRNCAQLQAQISQLERESATRTVETNNKKRMQLEAEIHRLNNEKRQLEKIIETREQNYLQKYKVFESQINMLQEQLDSERRRRRDLLANTAASSVASSAGRRPGSGANKPPFRI
ncbi:hypothetical protein FO519_008772 [Halicephalobus sp. NKZ332]|nr:hypothetical protein FO519_008772 [Halicephalobus sp. NKZ332]